MPGVGPVVTPSSPSSAAADHTKAGSGSTPGWLAGLEAVDQGALNLILGGADPSVAKSASKPLAKAQTKVPVVGPALQSVGQAASTVGTVAGVVTSGSFWIGLGEAVLAIVFLAIGLHALLGASGVDVSLPAGVRTLARSAA